MSTVMMRLPLPLTLVALALGCGAAEAGDDRLLTLSECQAQGGAPLFDPEDGRPLESSCPEGLHFIGEFTEPFFGSDGGICCSGPEPVEPE